MELKGSKTEANLMAAFAGESQARTKYTYYASKARKEGYNQIADLFEETARNEMEHAKIWFKLLHDGDVPDTKTNLKKRMEAEEGACAGKLEIAKVAKKLNLDAIHDTVHEMAKDEARHGAGFQGLYNRYFK